ncbi:hydroxymethylglutaryl-CoA reductase [Aspergillus floccosus]
MNDTNRRVETSSLDYLAPSTRAKYGHVLEDITHITSHNTNYADVKIENFIGYSAVPIGLAGPLRIHGIDGYNNDTYAPMATTEAALIASCCRGCKAINQSGGVKFHIFDDGMSRAPVFRFAKPDDAIAFVQRLPDLQPAIIEQAESTSRRARVKKLTPYVIGSDVHLHFDYTCGDATGQNMVTIATQWLGQKTVLGQCDNSSRRPSNGLGDAIRNGLQNVLGLSAESLYIARKGGEAGAIRNGLHGNNMNTANVLAAIFIAAGQDAASVGEASWCHTVLEYDRLNRCLNASVYFPSLPVGVVGGGTSYPTQQEALRIMKCTRTGGKHRLAGVIASFALALELSTSAAIGNNTFSQGHQLLARGPPVDRYAGVKL